jgi:hypothetical protein
MLREAVLKVSFISFCHVEWSETAFGVSQLQIGRAKRSQTLVSVGSVCSVPLRNNVRRSEGEAMINRVTI